MSTRQLHPRAITEFLVLAICITTFIFTAIGVLAVLMGSGAAGSRDFIEYWASAHQVLHHADPYDASSILKLEQSAGFPTGLPALIMGNPPSALLLMLPLGLLSPGAGELLWELLLLASLAASIHMIRTMHGSPKSLLHLLGFSFAPALSCLLSGQVSIFVLLGLVLFLRLNSSNPFVAGASLWLCLLKPHLFLPFGIVLLLWILRTRSYKILAGTVFALSLSSAIVTLLDPAIWMQYARMMSTERIDRVRMPCLGSMLRIYVSPHTLWLQCLPAALGCIWAITYFLKRRDKWDWIENGSLLILVSVFVAPYTWLMDQAVLIPALLHGAYLTHSRILIAILALMSAVIEIGIICGIPLLHSDFYLWTAPAWLIWYLCAVRSGHTSNQRDLLLHTSGAAEA